MIKGKDLILSIDGTPVAAAKSCSIEVSRNNIAVASPIDGMWKHFIPECIEWSASVECLCTNGDSANALMDAMVNGTEVTVKFYDLANEINKTGKALISSVSFQGSVGSLARVGVSFQGSGAFEDSWITLTPNPRSGFQDVYYKANSDETTAVRTTADDTQMFYDLATVSGRRLVKIVANDTEVIYDPTNSTYEFIVGDENIPLSLIPTAKVVRAGETAVFEIPSGRTSITLIESFEDWRTQSTAPKFYVNG